MFALVSTTIIVVMSEEAHAMLGVCLSGEATHMILRSVGWKAPYCLASLEEN
jgi:hypothetical protein